MRERLTNPCATTKVESERSEAMARVERMAGGGEVRESKDG